MPVHRLYCAQFFRGGMPFEVHPAHYESGYPEHTHDFSEIVIFTGGQGRHTLDACPADVMVGDVFVLRGDVSHGIQDSRNLEFYNLLFLPDELRRLADLRRLPSFQALFLVQPCYAATGDFRPHLRLGSPELAAAVHLLERLQEEIASRLPARLAMARALFQELIILLSREYERRPPPVDSWLRRLSEAVAWLEQHYKEEVRLIDLARRAACTPRHFTRKFHKLHGTSPMERVICLRMEHACRLLHNTDLPITEVATQSGFNDSNFFTRQFRRRFRIAPRDYRAARLDPSFRAPRSTAETTGKSRFRK